ncbi:MAG: hypothetical protein ACT4PT_04055 [Methanobacteriota archaeon]
MSVLTSHRVARVQPLFEGATFLKPHAFSTRLRELGIQHALCMLSAANEWAFYEPLYSIQLYIPRNQSARVHREARTGNIPVEVFAENFAELPTTTRSGTPVTSLFVTILDCRAHPTGGAHAAFLEGVLERREARTAPQTG